VSFDDDATPDGFIDIFAAATTKERCHFSAMAIQMFFATLSMPLFTISLATTTLPSRHA